MLVYVAFLGFIFTTIKYSIIPTHDTEGEDNVVSRVIDFCGKLIVSQIILWSAYIICYVIHKLDYNLCDHSYVNVFNLGTLLTLGVRYIIRF